VRLTYPSGDAGDAAAAASWSGEGVRAAAYTPHPSNRILIRVLGPHFEPIEAWFDRSEGRGVIGDVPPGARISVEVDEYDNSASTLGTGAPLLGRGWTRGITLAPGEAKTVEVAMHDKGTIVTVCGAPASGGAGTSGDSGDGGLGTAARLGYPSAVKAGPDDAIYVSSSMHGRVRRIDRYGYIAHFAGDGNHGGAGSVAAGDAAATAPIGFAADIDADSDGNIYLLTHWNQIYKVAGGVVAAVAYDNGTTNPNAWLNMAVADNNTMYFVNSLNPRIYRIYGYVKTDFVKDDAEHDTTEPFDRSHYPVSSPSGIAYVAASDSLVFADTANNRIMRLSLSDLGIRYLVADAGGAPFSEGVSPLAMAPVLPRAVEGNPFTGKIFFVEDGGNRVLHIDAGNAVRTFAGTGTAGFSGDGGQAKDARLTDPRAVTVDSRGNVYIADCGNHAIRMVVGGALP
jgi:sugar lactone lactonase YvrE